MKVLVERSLPTLQATKTFAKHFYETYLKEEKAFTVFFEGGLGVGKTFLIGQLLPCFGLEQQVSSPTYVYLQEYTQGSRHFAHFDFYRFSQPQEFFARGFEEIAEDPNINSFVEWPEKISPTAHAIFSGKRFTVQLAHGVGAGMRKVKLLAD